MGGIQIAMGWWVLVARHGWGLDRHGWLQITVGEIQIAVGEIQIAMGGFKLRGWLWVGSDHCQWLCGCGAVGAHEWPWFCSTWAAMSLGFGGCG